MIDIAVIGGGIQGAGIAQAAVAAGYSVAVYEQFAELAQGTSSRSSKLVHGGLRYLQTAQFSLVAECLRERALLLKNVPELVKLVPFYIPVYRTSKHRALAVRAGLSLYALLGRLRQEARFSSLPRSEWHELDQLKTDDLTAVFKYYDGQTDDALLTAAVMRSATNLGATLWLNAEVIGIALKENGCELRVNLDGKIHSHKASAVINATGPWVNRIIERTNPTPPEQSIELIQGTHIVVPGALEKGIYYVEAPRDRRAVFIIPWQGNVMVGTTETAYTGDPAEVRPTAEDIGYLLETLGHYFPALATSEDRVIQAFAGLRCLARGHGTPSSRPRDTILFPDREHRPRLVTVYGGKLTAYRATAEKALMTIRPSLPHRQPIADTKKIRLTV